MSISRTIKKNRICKLIKLISDHHGGDDIDWLRGYCREVIQKNKDDLNVPLAAFLDIASDLDIDLMSELEVSKPPLPSVACSLCNFVPPFCEHRNGENC
jgi:hypothetical protein